MVSCHKDSGVASAPPFRSAPQHFFISLFESLAPRPATVDVNLFIDMIYIIMLWYLSM